MLYTLSIHNLTHQLNKYLIYQINKCIQNVPVKLGKETDALLYFEVTAFVPC